VDWEWEGWHPNPLLPPGLGGSTLPALSCHVHWEWEGWHPALYYHVDWEWEDWHNSPLLPRGLGVGRLAPQPSLSWWTGSGRIGTPVISYHVDWAG